MSSSSESCSGRPERTGRNHGRAELALVITSIESAALVPRASHSRHGAAGVLVYLPNGALGGSARAELRAGPFPVTIGRGMSRSWQRFSRIGGALVYALAVAGCGMRTLELVDERRSSVEPPPVEAAVPDVSETDPTVGTSSGTQPAHTTTAPNVSPGVGPQPPFADAGGMLSVEAGHRWARRRETRLRIPFPDCVWSACLIRIVPTSLTIKACCVWGGECREACHTDDFCGCLTILQLWSLCRMR